MRVLTKNGHNFVTGMFWQIPDEGKRNINFAKLIKDTKHNMYCQIKNINHTWGFCRKEELDGLKKVASLGKFIISASRVSANYANSIICYKFKEAGELDSEGKVLKKALYGYIVLLNGTICPDDGEYVSEFEAIKESVIQKAKLHEIEILYLTSEVAGKFFSIFEILQLVSNYNELLEHIINTLSDSQKKVLEEFIDNHLAYNHSYSALFKNLNALDLSVICNLIKEKAFEDITQATKEQNLRYLIPNVYIVPYTSEQIYWRNPKFKTNFNNALIKPLSSVINNKYKFAVLTVLISVLVFITYDYYANDQIKEAAMLVDAPLVPRVRAINPKQLIIACLVDNDKYFSNLGKWVLNSLKCDSSEINLSFTADTDVTFNDFRSLIGTESGISLRDKTGVYIKPINRIDLSVANSYRPHNRDVLSDLQKSAIKYRFDLKLSNEENKERNSRFYINSQLSPLFLLKSGVLNDLFLREIIMNFDRNTGFYHWVIEGEF